MMPHYEPLHLERKYLDGDDLGLDDDDFALPATIITRASHAQDGKLPLDSAVSAAAPSSPSPSGGTSRERSNDSSTLLINPATEEKGEEASITEG